MFSASPLALPKEPNMNTISTMNTVSRIYVGSYIDWERVARDMRLGGDVTYVEQSWQEVWVFWRS